MFYTNTGLEKEEKEMEWGTLYQYEAGEEGRGRRLLCLPTSPNAEDIEVGLHKDLTIGFTKTGRPRVNKAQDSKMYMLLSAAGGYTRRGNGTVQCLENQKEKIKVLAKGNGADGAAGRVGFWDVLLLEVPEEVMIRVRTSGAGYGTPSDLYIVHSGDVYHCTVSDLEELCENIGIDVPCQIKLEEGKIFLGDDWVVL